MVSKAHVVLPSSQRDNFLASNYPENLMVFGVFVLLEVYKIVSISCYDRHTIDKL